MSKMLLPMFLMESYDPAQIVFRFSMRPETNRSPATSRPLRPFQHHVKQIQRILHGG